MKSSRARPNNASPAPWWIWLAAMVLIGIVYRQVGSWLVANWLANTYYSHGFIVPAVSAFLALMRLRGSERIASSLDLWLGIAIVSVSLVGQVWAVSRGAMLVSALTLIPLLCGLVLALAGRKALQRCAFAIGFLVAMMPLPFLEQWTPSLARWIANSVGDASRLLGIDVIIKGARIEMPQAALIVGAPCSGINSLAALLTLACLFAYLQDGAPWARILLIVLAIPIALAANWLRVLILVLVAHGFGVDAAMRYFHDWSSLVLFGLAILLLMSAAKVLRCQTDFDTLY